MRMMMGALLCLFMLVSHADAEWPTKTIANGGWFALSQGVGYPELAATYCGGLPCTEQNFASYFGPSIWFRPGEPQLFPTRGAAEQTLKSGDFWSVCQPGFDSGQTITIVSGYVQLYSLGHFSAAELRQSGKFFSASSLVGDYLNTIIGELSGQGLGGLAYGNELMNAHTGEVLASGMVLPDLDVAVYDAVKRWAGQQGLALHAYKVKYLRAVDTVCP